MGADDKNGPNELGNASKEAQATLMDEKEIKTIMSNGKIYKNLLLVTAAFLLNMGSYMTLEGLQSSLNKEAGTTSVSAVYTAFVLTSFFLPTLAMEFLKSRKAMVVGTIPYAIYSLANCYPRPYTLIPAGILLGAGASVVWSANRVYISDISGAYAKQNKRDEGKTTSHFYGIFWAIFSTALLIGNVVSSAVLQAFAIVPEEIVTGISNTTESYNNLSVTEMTTTVAEANQAPLRCALHNCDEMPGNSTLSKESEDSKTELNPTVLYVLFGTFSAIQLASAFLLLFFADEAPDREMSPEDNNKMAWKSSDEEKVVTHNTTENTEEASVRQRVTKQTLATAKFLIFNHSAKALIPITIHIGVLQGYAFGQFTNYWITCVIGIEFVGYVASMFGIGSTLGGYSSGYLAQHIGRFTIMVVAWFIEMALMVFLLIWEPQIDEKPLFFVTFAIFGILHATYKTIITTATTLFFSSTKEAASASLSIWDPLGSAVAYAISTSICNRLYTILMMVLVTIGTILYLLIERRFKKSTTDDDKHTLNT